MPVVRATGGLADTVFDVDDPPEGRPPDRRPNGFTFTGADEAAEDGALDRAFRCAGRSGQRIGAHAILWLALVCFSRFSGLVCDGCATGRPPGSRAACGAARSDRRWSTGSSVHVALRLWILSPPTATRGRSNHCCLYCRLVSSLSSITVVIIIINM